MIGRFRMRGFGGWDVSLGAMAFGSAGVAVAGFMLFGCLIALTICAALFFALRWAYGAMFPKRIIKQECSPGLLAWASKTWPDHKVS